MKGELIIKLSKEILLLEYAQMHMCAKYHMVV